MAAELLKRLFVSEITEALRNDNSYMQFAKNDDAFVNNNSVELPHAGTDPTVAINRASFPGTITQRTDAATQYLLEELSTDPSLLQYSEEMTVAYNKRASLNAQHVESLRQKMGDRLAYKWAVNVPAAGKIATTGVATRISSAPSGTGSVKKLVKADLLKLRQYFDDSNIPQTGRKLMLTGAMYNDILNVDDFTHVDKFGMSVIPDGLVGRIFGFDIFVRSRTLVYSESVGVYTIKDTETAPAATDVSAAIAWHPDFVRRARGGVKVFLELEKADYYGSVMSAIVRFGGLNARNDVKGIATIIETK